MLGDKTHLNWRDAILLAGLALLLAWVRLGQKAHASADAYPREIFEAEVAYIAPSIDAQRGADFSVVPMTAAA